MAKFLLCILKDLENKKLLHGKKKKNYMQHKMLLELFFVLTKDVSLTRKNLTVHSCDKN